MALVRGLCFLAVFLVCNVSLPASEFELPLRLSADGKVIDTGEAWGHSGPCVEDMDGDGLEDLLVGDFGGKFRLYKNVGKRGQPVYEDTGFIQAGDEDANVRIYCCVGSQARFADLDGDGLRDLISNSYDPGHCYLFRGLPDYKFAAREELLDKSGVPVRSAPEQQQDYQSFGSFFTPVDWDADGDFDMLIGCFDGHLKLRKNEGTPTEFSFATENETIQADNEPLKVEAHCCPVVVDWDGDGLWDIVAGSDDGSVTWFRNLGTEEAPRFAAGEILVEKCPHNGYEQLLWSEEEIVPGIRAQVEVVDYNGDRKLDLLVGDFYTAFEPRDDLTDEEKSKLETLIADQAQLGKEVADKMKALRKEFQERYPGEAIYSEEANEQWSKSYKDFKEIPEYKAMEAGEADWVAEIRPFLAKTRGEGKRSFDLALSHGHVWLFLRKDSLAKTTAPSRARRGESQFVTASLSLNKEQAKVGDTAEVSVELAIAPMWEIRSLDAEPREVATRLDLRLPAGIETAGDWKTPKTVRSLSGDGHRVYTVKAVFTRPLMITDASPAGEKLITCEVHYQACNERQCLQPTKLELITPLIVD